MFALGIDIGGTSIKGGVVADSGKLFDTFKCQSLKMNLKRKQLKN